MAFNSFSSADVLALNKACGVSALPQAYGHKFGGVRAVFSATAGKAIGDFAQGLTLPKGAVITRVVYKVLTTFVSATSAGTIALKMVSANDIVSAAAISTNVWNSGTVPVATLVTPTLSTCLSLTADTDLTISVAVEALTAGKMVVWVDYLYHGDVEAT